MVHPLHLIRGSITHSLMNAIAIIKALDVIEDCQPRILSGHEVMVMHPFILQVGEEALRHRIIVRRLPAIHARLHPGLC